MGKRYKHGLAVMRCQPFHIGHKRLIDRMLSECEMVTIVLGSIQESGTETNPFSFFERKQMIKDTYKFADRSPIVTGLCDLGDPPNWARFVLDYMKDFSVVGVDAYYAGSKSDLSCWESKYGIETILMPRNNEDYPYSSGTMIRNMIMNQDVRWRLYVPEPAQTIVKRLFEKHRWNQMGHLSEARSKVSGR